MVTWVFPKKVAAVGFLSEQRIVSRKRAVTCRRRQEGEKEGGLAMFKRPALSGLCSTNLKKRPPASGDRFIRHACMLILSPLAYMHMLPCVPMLMLMFTPCLFADDITFVFRKHRVCRHASLEKIFRHPFGCAGMPHVHAHATWHAPCFRHDLPCMLFSFHASWHALGL